MILTDLVNRKNASSIIKLQVPLIDGSSETIYGILTSEPKLSYKNNWEGSMPGLQTLTQVSELFGADLNGNVIAWLNGSMAAWNGTDPTKLNLEFKLITISPNCNIKYKVGLLASLASLSAADGNQITQDFTVKVHNGYYNDFWVGNGEAIAGNFGSYSSSYQISRNSNNVENATNWGTSANVGDKSGTLKISFSGLSFKNMLLENIDIQTSREMINESTPLYIEVTASFRGVLSTISSEIDYTFGTSVSNLSSPNPTPPNPNPVSDDIIPDDDSYKDAVAYFYTYGINEKVYEDIMTGKNQRGTDLLKLEYARETFGALTTEQQEAFMRGKWVNKNRLWSPNTISNYAQQIQQAKDEGKAQ